MSSGKHEKKDKRTLKLDGCLLMAASLAYMELLLQFLCGLDGSAPVRVFASLCAGLAIGTILCLIGGRAAFFTEAVLLECCTVVFIVQEFLYNAYKVFMSPGDVAAGAGGVTGEFSDVVWEMIGKGWWVILLFHVPMAVLIAKRKGIAFPKGKAKLRRSAILACCALFSCGFVSAFSAEGAEDSFASFSDNVRGGGLIKALAMSAKPQQQEEAPLLAPTRAAVSAFGGSSSSEGPAFFGFNKLDADLDALMEESSGDILAATRYVVEQKPTKRNEYTGLFEGKNLIFITAEAFSAEVIDEKLTPTLYRMATKGIQFKEYYQPAWGGSTSTGEFSNIFGIVPTEGVRSIQRTIGHDNSTTIGSKLKALGYFSECYHNGEYTYYDRDETHTGFGYDNYVAKGSGMEEFLSGTWPESDLEMMQFSLERYIDQQPFSVYYMTISGHCNYGWGGNAMALKNRDAVMDLEVTDRVKGYLAANLELEYALAYTVECLEKEGIADDTVIVLGTDHYPYGLEKSTAWGNDRDYLADLYGYAYTNPMERDHSALIIWSGCLEKADPIVVDAPVHSLDILPTLCNLFGVEYDSRLLVGRDVFSEAEPLVMWTNGSFKTDKGFYNAGSGRFTPDTDEEGNEIVVSDEYVAEMRDIVRAKIRFSSIVLNQDYYRYFDEYVK